MSTFLIVVHIMTCITLIAVVLLQRGKGADMGAALGGGGGNTVFGSRGAGNFLTKITSASAIIFMLTSLSLSFIGTREADELIFDEEEPAAVTAPLEEVQEVEPETAAGTLEEVFPPAPGDSAQPQGAQDPQPSQGRQDD